MMRHSLPRHCERSEAIHGSNGVRALFEPWIASAERPRNDDSRVTYSGTKKIFRAFTTSRTLLRTVLAAILLATAPVAVAEPNQLIGSWIENYPNGHQMVTQFTPNTIATMTRDTSGLLSKPIASGHVAYRDLGTSNLGKCYGVDFLGSDGKPGGGMMAFLKTPDDLVLDFPGVGAHKLQRLSK